MKNILVVIVTLVSISALATYSVNQKISKDFGRPLGYFINLAIKSTKTSENELDIVMLGVDPRNDRLEKTEATDTIIYARYQQKTKQLHLFPLPRDLWYEPINSKINQIYSDSKTKPDPTAYITNTFSQLTGRTIKYYLILTTKDLKSLVDIVNGVEVTLTDGFTDKQYPNSDYIVSLSTDIPIYKTVTFPKGRIQLDADNITEFVRSRKGVSDSGKPHDDLERIERQQLVIDALITKLKNPQIYNYSRLVKLYHLWSQELDTNLSDLIVMSIVKVNPSTINQLSIVKHSLGHLFYHPVNFSNKQWVFLPLNNNYKTLTEAFLVPEQ